MSTTRDGMLCKIDGRGYVLDVDELAFASIDPTRQGVDQGAGAGSSSLSNQVVWRRVRDNFVGGAGQDYADLEGDEDPSSSIRFAESVGMEAFERRQLTLHNPIIHKVWAPVVPNSGAAFLCSGSTLLSKLFTNDGVSTYTRLVFQGAGSWLTTTAAPGIILASGDTDTLAKWRWRVLTTAGNTYQYLDINTTGAGTTHNITLQSSAVTGVSDGDVFQFAIRVRESGANIDAEFAFYEVPGSGVAQVYRPRMVTGQGHAGYASGPAASAAGAYPENTTTVHIGNGYVPGSTTWAGADCVPLGFAMSVDNSSSGFGTNNHDYSVDMSLFDGKAWRDSATAYDFEDQQGKTGTGFYWANATGLTVTLVKGTLLEADDAASGETASLPAVAGSSVSGLTTGGWHINPTSFLKMGVSGSGDELTLSMSEVWLLGGGVATSGIASFGSGFFAVMTDGDVWEMDGTDLTVFKSGTFTIIGVANSRVLVADNHVLSELNADTTTTVLYTHHNTNFDWQGVLGAPGGIYAYGFTGGVTEIYRLPLSDATGAIAAPVPVGSLPVGEQVTQVIEHEGVLLLASSSGLRIALIQADGSLVMGASVAPNEDSLVGLAANGRYCWAVGESSRIYKFDLSRFTEPDSLVPAWEQLPALVSPDGTTERWSSTLEQVTGVGIQSSYSGAVQPVFVSQVHASSFDGDLVLAAPATIDFGWFTYGIGELLAFDSVLVECDPVPVGSEFLVTVHVDTPDEDDVVEATSDLAGSPIFDARYVGDLRARRFRVRLTVTPDATAGTGPVVRQVVLKAVPAPDMSDEMLLPIILQDSVETEHGQASAVDVWEEWSHLIDLRNSRQPVTLRIGSYERTVRIEGLEVRGGGLGGGNGLLGYDRDDEFLAGRWNVRIITLD